jgi:dihydrofolate synthase/folylpolyglutamate synthase
VTEERDGLLDWLYGLSVHGIKMGLDNTRELLQRIGDPQDSFRSMHVAGTDGKGSVSAMLFSVLCGSGIRAGLYTSPHLVDFNERIRTCDGVMTDAELLSLVGEVAPAVDDMAALGRRCTFFEATTAMAFLHFKRKGVEYAVTEVGMGGRFDSTNVIRPDVCVINNIGLEHTAYLGDTVEKIAFEKAGIIKPGVPVITLNPEPAFGVIAAEAARQGSPLTRVDPGDIKVTENGAGRLSMTYKGEAFEVGMPGRHQSRNAALAVEALRASPTADRTEGFLRGGLRSARWPCRMERIEGLPLILDVTHTVSGSECLASDIAEIYGKVVLVFGMLGDKDMEHVARNLSSVADTVVVTVPDSERASPAEEEMETVGRYFDQVLFEPDVGSAIERAMALGDGRHVLVTGSLYMAGDALRWLRRTYARY